MGWRKDLAFPSCLRILLRSGLWPLCCVDRASLQASCSPLALGCALLLASCSLLLRLLARALGLLWRPVKLGIYPTHVACRPWILHTACEEGWSGSWGRGRWLKVGAVLGVLGILCSGQWAFAHCFVCQMHIAVFRAQCAFSRVCSVHNAKSRGQSSTCNISLGDIRYAPTQWILALFLGFVNFWSNAPKHCLFFLRGGMCILFEMCEKRPFQKCMGWGGGRWSHFWSKRSCKFDDAQDGAMFEGPASLLLHALRLREGKPKAENEFPGSVAVFLCSAFANTS